MISKEQYDTLSKQYGSTSSWTIWATPNNDLWKTKSNISDVSFFQNQDIIEYLSPDYIFVGQNPADHTDSDKYTELWKNFHSGDTKRSQDYKLRYALKDTKYWGCFITDIYPSVIETDSNCAMRKTNKVMTTESIERLLQARTILGGHAVIVAIGGKAYQILKKELREKNVCLKKITHYSYRINIDKYRQSVLTDLSE